VQSLYHADSEYVFDIAVGANGEEYIVTHTLTHYNFHICVMYGFRNLH